MTKHPFASFFPRRKFNRLPALMMTLLLSACLSQEPPANIYVLNAPAPATGGDKINKTLEVAAPTAAPGLGTERIALKHSPNTLDFYAGARWPRPLPEVVQSIVIKTLEQDGQFSSVSDDETGTSEDLIVSILIQDFQAEYTTKGEPPEIQVTLSTKISDAATHKILGSFIVSKSLAAKSNTVADIIHAFDRSLQQSLSEIAVKSAEIATQQPVPVIPETTNSQ